MSLLSTVNSPARAAVTWLLLALGVAVLLLAGDAFAVDGNYASPYASQYDSRSTSASVPWMTWIGVSLLLVNVTAASVFALRSRRRLRA